MALLIGRYISYVNETGASFFKVLSLLKLKAEDTIF
jgi:hypothetical protein